MDRSLYWLFNFSYVAAVGVQIGREVGRVAGGQSAAIAAAEELSKMNMAEITEEKAVALKAHFVELGTRIGKETGTKAGEAAGHDIDMALPIKEAQEAARQAAEKGAMKAKELIDALKDKAERAGADAGEKAGKVSQNVLLLHSFNIFNFSDLISDSTVKFHM